MDARLRAVAATDVESAIDHYLDAAGPDTAQRFVDDLEAALKQLTRHPHSGSLRFAYELEIPSLRCWSLATFPYIVFYVADDDHLDIWRVLHARRDMPAHLGDEDEAHTPPPEGT